MWWGSKYKSTSHHGSFWGQGDAVRTPSHQGSSIYLWVLFWHSLPTLDVSCPPHPLVILPCYSRPCFLVSCRQIILMFFPGNPVIFCCGFPCTTVLASVLLPHACPLPVWTDLVNWTLICSWLTNQVCLFPVGTVARRTELSYRTLFWLRHHLGHAPSVYRTLPGYSREPVCLHVRPHIESIPQSLPNRCFKFKTAESGFVSHTLQSKYRTCENIWILQRCQRNEWIGSLLFMYSDVITNRFNEVVDFCHEHLL